MYEYVRAAAVIQEKQKWRRLKAAAGDSDSQTQPHAGDGARPGTTGHTRHPHARKCVLNVKLLHFWILNSYT